MSRAAEELSGIAPKHYRVHFGHVTSRGGRHELSVTVFSPDIPNTSYPEKEGIAFYATWWSDTIEPRARIKELFALLERGSHG